jgi:hypothetical protein
MFSFTDNFFLDASTTETIETGLKNIASVKNIGNTSQDALKWLANNQEDWLLFYDNADDPKIDLNRFIPQCNHGNIIITTRNPTLRSYAGAHFAVSDMEESDAVELLLKSAGQDISSAGENIVAEIVKVGCSSVAHSVDLTFQRNCATFLWPLCRLEHSSYNLERWTAIWTFIGKIRPTC